MAKVKLIDAPVGLFLYDGCMVLKTEYCTESDGSTPDCYIVSSGEYFWGGVKTIKERNALEVTPIKAKPERQGRWNPVSNNSIWQMGGVFCRCTECKMSTIMCNSDRHNYCPNCGAKMDGKGGAENA